MGNYESCEKVLTSLIFIFKKQSRQGLFKLKKTDYHKLKKTAQVFSSSSNPVLPRVGYWRKTSWITFETAGGLWYAFYIHIAWIVSDFLMGHSWICGPYLSSSIKESVYTWQFNLGLTCVACEDWYTKEISSKWIYVSKSGCGSYTPRWSNT